MKIKKNIEAEYVEMEQDLATDSLYDDSIEVEYKEHITNEIENVDLKNRKQITFKRQTKNGYWIETKGFDINTVAKVLKIPKSYIGNLDEYKNESEQLEGILRFEVTVSQYKKLNKKFKIIDLTNKKDKPKKKTYTINPENYLKILKNNTPDLFEELEGEILNFQVKEFETLDKLELETNNFINKLKSRELENQIIDLAQELIDMNLDIDFYELYKKNRKNPDELFKILLDIQQEQNQKIENEVKQQEESFEKEISNSKEVTNIKMILSNYSEELVLKVLKKPDNPTRKSYIKILKSLEYVDIDENIIIQNSIEQKYNSKFFTKTFTDLLEGMISKLEFEKNEMDYEYIEKLNNYDLKIQKYESEFKIITDPEDISLEKRRINQTKTKKFDLLIKYANQRLPRKNYCMEKL
jgi:hypothetical protein